MKYYMGTDEGGFFGNSFAVAVVDEEGVVQCVEQTRDKALFKGTVEGLMEIYEIPKSRILKVKAGESVNQKNNSN